MSQTRYIPKGHTCGWILPSWGQLSRVAEKHAQANTDCNGALVPD